MTGGYFMHWTVSHKLTDCSTFYLNLDFSPVQLEKQARLMLQHPAYMDTIYGLQQDEGSILTKIKEYIPAIKRWAATYLHSIQGGPLDFKKPGYSKHDSEISAAKIEDIADIEENIWSPRFGLKGIIDSFCLKVFERIY